MASHRSWQQDYCMTLSFQEPPRKKHTYYKMEQSPKGPNIPIDHWLEGKVACIDSIIGWKIRYNVDIYFIALGSSVVTFGIFF